jgi:hypothetical protein
LSSRRFATEVGRKQFFEQSINRSAAGGCVEGRVDLIDQFNGGRQFERRSLAGVAVVHEVGRNGGWQFSSHVPEDLADTIGF